MFGLFDEQGETESNRLAEEVFARQVHQVGFRENLLVGMVHGVLTKLQEVRRWNHYCDKCFRRVVEDLADVALLKRGAGKKVGEEPALGAPKPAAPKPVLPKPEPPPPPPPPPPPLPPIPEAPEEPEVVKAPRGRPKGSGKPKAEPEAPVRPQKGPEPKPAKAPASKSRSLKDGLPL
jgi:outer membrane biosynthesis protein TonB